MVKPDFVVERQNIPSASLNLSARSAGGDVSAARALGTFAGPADLAADLMLRDREQLDRFDAMRTLNEAKTSAEIRLEEMKLKIKPGGRDFAQEYKAERELIFSQAKTNIAPKLLPEFEARFADADQSLGKAAFLTEMGVRDNYYKTELQNNLDSSLVDIDKNPDVYWDKRRTGEALINEAGIATADKAAFLKNWRANTEIARFNRIKELDPEKAATMIGGQISIKNPNKLFVMKAVRAEAEAQGIDPDLAAAVAYRESGLEVDKPGPARGTTIKGLFQQDKDSQEKFGYAPGLEGNVKSGIRDMKARIAQFRRDFGRAPNAMEYYLYHMQGVGGGKLLLETDNNADYYETLANAYGKNYADKVIQGNPYFKGMTVGDVIVWSAKTVNNGLNAVGGKAISDDIRDPSVANIPYDKVIALRASAESDWKVAQNEAYVQSERVEAQTREATYKEAIELYVGEKLTVEYVEGHKDLLSADQYSTLLRLAHKAQGDLKYDATEHAELMMESIKVRNDNEAGVVFARATEALSKNQIDQTQFNGVIAMTNSALGQERRDTPTRLAVFAKDLATSLPPRSRASVKHKQIAEKAVADLSMWALEKPDATQDDWVKKTAELKEEMRAGAGLFNNNTNAKQVVQGLPNKPVSQISEAEVYDVMVQTATEMEEGKIDINDPAIKTRITSERRQLEDMLSYKGTPYSKEKYLEARKAAKELAVERKTKEEAATKERENKEREDKLASYPEGFPASREALEWQDQLYVSLLSGFGIKTDTPAMQRKLNERYRLREYAVQRKMDYQEKQRRKAVRKEADEAITNAMEIIIPELKNNRTVEQLQDQLKRYEK